MWTLNCRVPSSFSMTDADRFTRAGREPVEQGGVVLIDVIGAGFGRTGTFSLKLALEQLGLGPCYHMFEVRRNEGHREKWLDMAEGRGGDWEEILAGYRSAVDWPVAAFYEPLMHRYPEAKVVLTVREFESWFKSAHDTILTDRPVDETLPPMSRRIITEGVFGGDVDDKEHVRAVFERHIAEVKRRVPAGRLLVYDVREGWEPLCAFLALPVPQEPFPHRNTTAEWRERRAQRQSS